jgi:pheromone shutdown protein TraB
MKNKRVSVQFRERYIKANQDWDTLALYHPLIHPKTNTKIHIVGVHHNSPASIHRVRMVIETLRPCGVLIELHKDSLGYVKDKQAIMTEPYFKQQMEYLVDGRKEMIAPRPDDDVLQFYGIDETEWQETILYGAEMAAAIETGNAMGSEMEYIDNSPNELQDMLYYQTNDNIAKRVQRQYRLYHHRYRSSPSLLGQVLYQLISLFVFRGVPVSRNIYQDFASIGEHKSHLQLWSRFHPSTWYWFVGLRDGVMTNRINTFVEQIPIKKIDDRLDSSTVVVVVGKAHYFGIKHLWNTFVCSCFVVSSS